MGFGFLLLIITLVPLSRAKDLRPPASAVDRRSAPDALLGEIFNDPSATSLTKLNLEDSDSDNDDFSGSGSELWSGSAQTAPQQSSTEASLTSQNVTTQGVDAKLPSTEDQSQNKVVQTEENDKSSNEQSSPNAEYFPAQTQNSLETVADNLAAAGFDDNSLYDPTIVKKTDVPVAADMLSNPLVNNTMDIPGTARSAIPQAPAFAPQAPAVRKSAAPFKGSFPLQLHKYSPYTKLMKKNMIANAGQDAAKKSVIPGLTDAGGLRPLSVNLPQQPQQQQDSPNAQGYPQTQAPALDVNPAQIPFGDQAQALPVAQPFAAVPTPTQPLADAPADASLQSPQQALDQVQGGVPQAPEQAFAPQVATPSDMQMPGPENVANAFPMNTTMNDAMAAGMPQETAGIPVQGLQAVPVYQGLKPKKPVIEEDQCDDQFDTCPEMAKNDYCTKYPDLMKIQCKKSCHFCEIKHDEGSGSANEEYDSGSASLYYADEVSGSGSSNWDDDSDEDDDPEYKKSGIPQPIHKVLMAKFAGDSGSASGASGMDETSVSDDDILQSSGSGEAGSGSQKKDEVNEAASGSGEAAAVPVTAAPTVGAAEIGSGSGSLAEDLATGTVSRANEKHSSIPRPVVAPQVSVYPKIDLKEIAKAVNVYRGVALKMLGEALEGAAEEKEQELSKKSRIPLPPATNILQQMGFPVGYDESAKRNMIPNMMQGPNMMMMAPNNGMMGYGNNGYAYNYPQPAGSDPLAAFYGQFQQQPNVARSDIMATPEEEAEQQQNEDEGAAQDEQPEEIQPVQIAPALQQENVTETAKEDKAEASQNKTSDDKDKKDKIVDPYEYVRNMGTGASMEPIRSKTASNLVSSHSDPLILWKNSQLEKLSTLAKKKSSIPQPESQPMMPAVDQGAFQFPEQQFRSDIPQQNITMSGMQDMSGQTFPESAPAFPQYTPQSEALTQYPADDLAARSQILQNQPQQQQGLLARLTPQQGNSTSADFKNAIPGSSLGVVVSNHKPLPGSFPLSLRKMVPGMTQKKDEMYKQIQEEINKSTVPSGSVDLFANQMNNNPAIASPVSQPAQMALGVFRSNVLPAINSQTTNNSAINNPVPQPAQMSAGVSRSDLLSLPADDVPPADGTENAAASINEAFTSPSILSQDQHSADPLFGSLNSKITTSFESADETPSHDPMDSFSTPEVQISGKIPNGDNMDNGIADSAGAFRGQVSKPIGTSSGTEKGTAKGKISAPSSASALPPLHHDAKQAENLPPLNHGIEMAGALPPLNHNIETASNLPPLNHGKEAAENLPPLMHGIEQASNLPPLNHGNDALQSFHSLPPLNHGMKTAENLPPLNHGIESNGLPPLNHDNEEAAILPPLLHGVEQAQHAPSANFEKQSSQNVDALSAFTSQIENAASLTDNGKQPYPKLPLDLSGVGRGPLVMPKTYNADTGNLYAPQRVVNQSFANNGNHLIKNYYNMMIPVVQGKEFIDRPLPVQNVKNETVNESENRKEIPLPEWDENAQSKGLVPSVYDDTKELQNLLSVDQMAQRMAPPATAAKFGIPGTSGPSKDPLANFLRIWQGSATNDSSSYPSKNWLDNTNYRNLSLGNSAIAKPTIKNKDVSGNEKKKSSLKKEIAKEKAEIVDSLGKLEMGLEEALAETRGNVPTPQPSGYNVGNSQPFQVQVPSPSSANFQTVKDGSVDPSAIQFNPTLNKLTDSGNPNINPPRITGISQTPGVGTNPIINSYNAAPGMPQDPTLPYLSNVNQPKANDEFQRQRLAPNQIANELTSNVNLQTQSLRFNQVANKPNSNGLSQIQNLGLNMVANQPRNSTEFDDGNPLTSQPPYNNEFNLPNFPSSNQPYVNPYLNPGELTQSYVGKPPLTPPLEHAYPSSHEHVAFLPPLNHQQLPPLNHNNLVATETSRYTGSDVNAFSSPGQARSNPAPPIYPFTIPPEGEQENQGYHGNQGSENNNEAIKTSSQASARGSLPSAQSPYYPGNQAQPAVTRQWFPEGGKPYPKPLPPEGSQNDPVNTGDTQQSFDSQLLEDPSPFPSAQLSAAWKKGQNKAPKGCDGDEWCPYPWYPTPLPPEGQQSDQTNRRTEANANPNGNIGKKNLIRPKPDLQCGAGWTGALGDFGSFCYKEVFERKTWDNAHHTCKNFGGDLFSVTNAYEQRFLENFTSIESWLGYRDKSRDGTWTWSDSSLSVFTDWDSSAKDDHGKGRDCVLLSSKEGKWKDASCSQTHDYLCKKKVEDCGKGWKKLTLNSVRGCYKLFKEPKTWEHALVSCMDEQASLASILSDDEETMISQVYSKSDFWIGYNDIDNEGDWVWSDRMTSSYTNWDDKSPNNGGVSCAIVTRTGKWHDEPCQGQYSFICKKPSPKGPHHPLNDATLTQEVEKFVSNKSLLNPDIDTSVTIFGRHSVTPQYLWTVQKISNSRIHGSNPIATHGKVKSVDGGLQLNGVDAWLDAGDFYGQCLGDPDLCIKGFSFALQLNFDDDALSYKDKRYVLDSSGNSRGVSIFIQNGSLFYKVVTSTKQWQLSMELVTNEWQDIAMTWKKEEGLMLYVNGAFRDSVKEGTVTSLIPNKQARLTIGRKSGNPPFKYTRMYVSSLYAFTRFLAPEDVPYVFSFDNTVVPRYMWLLPKLQDSKVTGSPDIEVNGPVRAVDGGVHLDGQGSFLKVGNFDGKCLHDPSKCPDGLSLSCKLKFNRVVRTYKEPHYILDSGGHQKGTKGLSAYLLNNNLYFSVAMSTDEDTLTWTVRTSIFTVRWQRVVLSWSLSDGLWLYTDSQFRGWTKTPKSVPRDVVTESGDFIVGRKNVGPDFSPAEFSIGSLAIFPRFLEKKDVEKLFSGKKMPYPGLIREVWKELPGKSINKLKDDPYYPNDPSLIEIIENFDSPFDIDKDYGSRVKGYFVAPETGNYTFYMSGSQSGELWMSSTESQQNLTKLVSLDQATGHNQWNKYAGQSSKSVTLEAGKYYYIIGLQKGTESTDSLSAGVRLPSGRFMRPITKEILQWRMPGDPFAGVIREVWQDIPGYRIMDLTSNPNFPNNPSSIEVLDKFDAPHNVDDNYGSRIRGFFKAPENGLYRFFLAADTTGELWLSSDETEKNLKKVVAINGWTAHNEWLKFPEQKSDRIHLKKGKYYYLEAYQKADKLADCASVAVELPSGHFEGPIKRVHLSWRLPDGRTGPGPSSEEEAIPKPVGLYPLNKAFGAKDAGPSHENGVLSNVDLGTGPGDSEDEAYEFKGTADSFVEIPNDGKLDTQNSMTILANVYPTGSGGPILNYKTDGWGVHLWQFESNELFVRFVHRNGVFHKPIASRVLQLNEWNQVGATYDNTTGVAQLWHNGKMVKSRNIGQIKLATQYPIRIGARDGDERRFAGKISCLQLYNKALDEQQIGNLKSCPVKAKTLGNDELDSGDGSGSGDWDDHDFDSSAVDFSHNAGKYDKDEDADDEIQGSESTSGNKCDPEPCENGAKCIRDNKRMDGYRCKCTSDFTGRNCQVSKPDAENPIVKKAKIPKPELKTGSEDYQKNASALNLIENIPEEKKEDVLLLFQKVGCFKDEVVKHDLPDRATVKSVTQEDCVRSCALEEKGYSYFGLQDADKCFCGHRYGKYGRADEALCNMPCKGNDKENCGGNSTNMVYFFGLGTNYTISTLTGDLEGADTDAKVYITLYGEKGDSGFRKLDTKHFARGKNETNTLVLPDLGKLRQVRILHDNSGSTPSWFLEKVTVTDENGRSYAFPCKEWLSETQGGGKTERLLRLPHT
ncbi:uncharacterized protein LOC144644082 isoform X3 [Oculina patagonica]